MTVSSINNRQQQPFRLDRALVPRRGKQASLFSRKLLEKNWRCVLSRLQTAFPKGH
jgi:hypothetical protein